MTFLSDDGRLAEEGVDQGGVSREFFQLLVGQLFSPDYGMFIEVAESHVNWFNTASLESLVRRGENFGRGGRGGTRGGGEGARGGGRGGTRGGKRGGEGAQEGARGGEGGGAQEGARGGASHSSTVLNCLHVPVTLMESDHQ